MQRIRTTPRNAQKCNKSLRCLSASLRDLLQAAMEEKTLWFTTRNEVEIAAAGEKDRKLALKSVATFRKFLQDVLDVCCRWVGRKCDGGVVCCELLPLFNGSPIEWRQRRKYAAVIWQSKCKQEICFHHSEPDERFTRFPLFAPVEQKLPT